MVQVMNENIQNNSNRDFKRTRQWEKNTSGEKTIHSVLPQNSVLEVESSCRNKSVDFSMVMTFKLENLYMPLHRVFASTPVTIEW